jgi:hypothetical protein
MLRLQGARGSHELGALVIPERFIYVPADFPRGGPFNIGPMYALFAEAIRTGQSRLPTFDTAADLHRFIDTIKQASDTARELPVASGAGGAHAHPVGRVLARHRRGGSNELLSASGQVLVPVHADTAGVGLGLVTTLPRELQAAGNRGENSKLITGGKCHMLTLARFDVDAIDHYHLGQRRRQIELAQEL